TPFTVAPSAAPVGITSNASAATRSCVAISCAVVVIASSGAYLTKEYAQHYTARRKGSRCYRLHGQVAWTGCAAINSGIRESHRQKNHSSKSALRVTQRANDHRRRACATR